MQGIVDILEGLFKHEWHRVKQEGKHLPEQALAANGLMSWSTPEPVPYKPQLRRIVV
ncbi:hypothetical protein QLG02_07485 [Aeromonas sp. V90_14]|uniref:hypothetical protein n=1 Tax=Aeromonas sp. V90_14 TaxID=3044241 RepID=UPI00249DE4D4|nr:hypothetical protein [Aeromonas sp. V90_14]MDI3430168.1 hypothetical protein [Aeromonas sp. V90_14]